VEIGLVLFMLTIVVNAFSRLLLWRVSDKAVAVPAAAPTAAAA
jgi:hypothetical protein